MVQARCQICRHSRRSRHGKRVCDVAENHTLRRVASFAFVIRRAPAPPPEGKCGLSPRPYGTEVTYGKDGFYPGQSATRRKENNHGKGAVLLPPAQRLHATAPLKRNRRHTGAGETARELRRIGNNLNQITVLAHQKQATFFNLEELKKEVGRLWQSVNSCLPKHR